MKKIQNTKAIWNELKTIDDLKNLPKHKYHKDITKCVLCTSDRPCTDGIYLMYFNFEDNCFHFPNYAPDWSDPKLKPISEINRWCLLPKRHRVKNLEQGDSHGQNN